MYLMHLISLHLMTGHEPRLTGRFNVCTQTMQSSQHHEMTTDVGNNRGEVTRITSAQRTKVTAKDGSSSHTTFPQIFTASTLA